MLRQDTDRACYIAQWGRGRVLCVLPLDSEHVYGLSLHYVPCLLASVCNVVRVLCFF